MKNSYRLTTAYLGSLTAIVMAVTLGGCSARAPAETTSEIEVLTVRVAPRAVTAVDELPGRVVAFRTAEIRPQVGGIIQRRLFDQGATVRAGQVLLALRIFPLTPKLGAKIG